MRRLADLQERTAHDMKMWPEAANDVKLIEIGLTSLKEAIKKESYPDLAAGLFALIEGIAAFLPVVGFDIVTYPLRAVLHALSKAMKSHGKESR